MKRCATLALVAIFTAVPAAAGEKKAPPRYATLDEAERNAIIDSGRAHEDLAARIAELTRPFLDTPYGLSPLGEGGGEDADPRVRWDLVDCLTFVETAIALAAAPRPDALVKVLDDVRYAADPPSFLNRNHFVEAQWLPNNLLKGYLRDIARDVAGDRAVVVTKAYSPERWTARKQLGDMPLRREDVPRGTFSLTMVPADVARERVAKIPAGTLLFVVRRDYYTQPTRVTHVGLVVDRRGGRVLRHASRNPYGRVVDEPLAQFLARNANYAKWPVEGFALYEIRVPAARIAQLLGDDTAATPVH